MSVSVLHALAEFDLAHGGPPRSVAALAEAQAGLENTNVAVAFGGDDSAARERLGSTAVRLYPCAGAGAGRNGGEFRRDLQAAMETARPEIVHDHGIWRVENWRVAQVARSAGVCHVIQPRGMLSAWALAQKRWRKRAAWWAYQRRDLHHAAGLIATSSAECADFRRAGLVQPVAVIPNGVTMPNRARAARSVAGTRTALFLSRLHPGKGLMRLLRAWARVRPAGWQLVIAGRDDHGLWQTADAFCRQAGLHEVRYAGSVSEAGASALYFDADLFVLPTESENFGLVIAEALAHGVPVLTTRGAPWQELIRYDCGWWIEPGDEALAHGLREATGCSRERLAQMGNNGVKLARKYSWPAAAAKTLQFYEWLLGRADRPGFVDLADRAGPRGMSFKEQA